MSDKDAFLGIRIPLEIKEALKLISPHGKMSEVAADAIRTYLKYYGPEDVRRRLTAEEIEEIKKKRLEYQQRLIILENEIRDIQQKLVDLDAKQASLNAMPERYKEAIAELGLRAIEKESNEMEEYKAFVRDAVVWRRPETRSALEIYNIYDKRFTDWQKERGVRIAQYKTIKLIQEAIEEINKAEQEEAEQKRQIREKKKMEMQMTDKDEEEFILFLKGQIDKNRQRIAKLTPPEIYKELQQDIFDWKQEHGKQASRKWVVEQIQEIILRK